MAPPAGDTGSYSNLGGNHSFLTGGHNQYLEAVDMRADSASAQADIYRNCDMDMNERGTRGSSVMPSHYWQQQDHQQHRAILNHSQQQQQQQQPNSSNMVMTMAALPSTNYSENADFSAIGNHPPYQLHSSARSSFSAAETTNTVVGITPLSSSPPPLPPLGTSKTRNDNVIELLSPLDYKNDGIINDTTSTHFSNAPSAYGSISNIMDPQASPNTSANTSSGAREDMSLTKTILDHGQYHSSSKYDLHQQSPYYDQYRMSHVYNIPNLTSSNRRSLHYSPPRIQQHQLQQKQFDNTTTTSYTSLSINNAAVDEKNFSIPSSRSLPLQPPPNRVSLVSDSHAKTMPKDKYQTETSASRDRVKNHAEIAGNKKEYNDEVHSTSESMTQRIAAAEEQQYARTDSKLGSANYQVTRKKGNTTEISGMTAGQQRDWNTTVVSNWPKGSFDTFAALAINTEILFLEEEEKIGLKELRNKQQRSEERREKDGCAQPPTSIGDTMEIIQKLMAKNVFTSKSSELSRKHLIVLVSLVDALVSSSSSKDIYATGKRQILSIGLIRRGGKEIRHLASRVLEVKHTPSQATSVTDDMNRSKSVKLSKPDITPNDSKEDISGTASSTPLLSFGDSMIDENMFEKFAQRLNNDDEIDNSDRRKVLSDKSKFRYHVRKIHYRTVESWTRNIPQIHGLDSVPSDGGSKTHGINEEWGKVLVRVPLKTFPVTVAPPSETSKPTVSICLDGFGFLPIQYFISGERDEKAIFGSYFPAVYNTGSGLTEMKSSKNSAVGMEDASFTTSPIEIRGGGIKEDEKEQVCDDKIKYKSHDFLIELIRPQVRKEGITDNSLDEQNSFDDDELLYSHAPLAEVWVTTHERKLIEDQSRQHSIDDWNIASGKPPNINDGGTLLGRRWVWDEGHYTDGDLANCSNDVCNTLEGLVDEKVTRTRRSERSASSVQTSTVLSELASGKLNPYTLVICENYVTGPEFRFLRKDNLSNLQSEKQNGIEHVKENRIQGFIHNSSHLEHYKHQRVNLTNSQIQPFTVRVCPDALILADLHAHLSESEIIGLLGGRYEPSERCIYIQAAFPCKSTVRTDGGHTDVEMDPVSQITVNECIIGQGLAVVGWYHSHPKFQPDPSVTDIENQQNYQRLYDSVSSSPIVTGNENICPFVGLIVGTYGLRNPSSASVMRWFHITNLKKENICPDEVPFPMKLNVVHRKLRNVDKDFTEGSIESIHELKQKFTTYGTLIRHNKDLAIMKEKLGIFPDADCDSLPQGLICTETESEDHAQRNKMISNNVDEVYDPEMIKVAIDRVFSSILSNHLIDLGPDGIMSAIDYHSKQVSLLSDIMPLFETQNEDTAVAYPLPYNEDEMNILSMRSESGVTNDHRAGVIWGAIEREQLMTNKVKIDCFEEMQLLPPSSDSILQLLLTRSQSEPAYQPRKNSSKRIIAEDDAVLVHMMDTVLSHYAKSSQKIDPFQSWGGAPDNGSQDIAIKGTKNGWQAYYAKNVMQSEKGGMKRGHKIASCLLEWANHMYLNDRDRWIRNKSTECTLGLDEGSDSLQRLPKDVEFVSEIMRLLAARWRESEEGKKKSINRNTKKDFKKNEPKTASPQKSVSPVKRKRGRPPWKHLADKQSGKQPDSRKRKAVR